MTDERSPHDEAVLAMKMIHVMRDFLAGRPPAVVSAVLADLLATYLAAHVIPGDEKQTDAAREELLAAHLALVRTLTPIKFNMHVMPQLKEKGLA